MAWTYCSGNNRGLVRDRVKVAGSGWRLGVGDVLANVILRGASLGVIAVIKEGKGCLILRVNVHNDTE